MSASARYSDKRLADGFSAYVLLSEPLQFRTHEILAAVREDFPGLEWSDTLGADMAFDSSTVSLGVFFADPKGGPQPPTMRIISAPGRCPVEWPDILHKSRYTFPRRPQRWSRMSAACGSASNRSMRPMPRGRFDAARRLTCLAAVFAKLPVCTGIYFPSADQLVRPADWVQAAEKAMEAKFPATQWVTLAVNPVPDGSSPSPSRSNHWPCGLHGP